MLCGVTPDFKVDAFGVKPIARPLFALPEKEFMLHGRAIPVFLVAKGHSLSSCDAEYYTSTAFEIHSIVPELTQRKLPHDAPLSRTGCAKQ